MVGRASEERVAWDDDGGLSGTRRAWVRVAARTRRRRRGRRRGRRGGEVVLAIFVLGWLDPPAHKLL